MEALARALETEQGKALELPEHLGRVGIVIFVFHYSFFIMQLWKELYFIESLQKQFFIYEKCVFLQ